MGAITDYISNWIYEYCDDNNIEGLVVGVSGGIDSALVVYCCAQTELPLRCVTMNVNDTLPSRAKEYIEILQSKFANVIHYHCDLKSTYLNLINSLPDGMSELAKANSRSRIMMTTLYTVATTFNSIVVGTGNKVEDFGVGFFTKYGDGGVDISPIADLMKSEVYRICDEIDVIPNSIKTAKPTDGLWDNGRTDEDQLGMSYRELEYAMEFGDVETEWNIDPNRRRKILKQYNKFRKANKHKMDPIPVCEVPNMVKYEDILD